MAEAVGYSRFYPAVPIMNVLSMVLCLLLIHGFWKTRIVALTSLVVWIFLSNLMKFIGMIQWRGNTDDVPILADVFAVFWRMLGFGCFASTACFAHFTWQRLQPLSMRQLSDTRRRNNLIHFVVSVIVPVLWTPLHLVSLPHRYVIIEDLGPMTSVRLDWPGFVVGRVPVILSFLAGILFNALALVNYWRMKRENIESDILKPHSSVRTRKLLLLALSNTLLAMYGISRPVLTWLKVELVAPKSFAENIASLQIVFHATRSSVEEEVDADPIGGFIVPLLGFYLFAWFGCGEEARKVYREALMKPVCLVGLAVKEHQPFVGFSPFPWSCIAFRRPKLSQGLANSLPLTRPTAPEITPYISAVPRDNGPQPSATPAKNNPSGPAGNVINIKWQGKVASREPSRRLSMHKSPSATLSQANAIPSGSNIPLRRLSHHKPPFIPWVPPNVPAIAGPDASGAAVAPRVEGMDRARRQEKFALRPPPRRISYHKPPFVPLGRPNGSSIATPGSTPPRMEGTSNTRRQENFAPRARPHRLSYRKPAFLPLAPPANDTSEVANASGPTVLLVEAPRDLIGDRNARLQAESALSSSVAPPPFSGPWMWMAPPPFSAAFASMSPPPAFLSLSTSGASPPLSDVSTPIAKTPVSTTSTRTPAPPYQHSNPFHDHVL